MQLKGDTILLDVREGRHTDNKLKSTSSAQDHMLLRVKMVCEIYFLVFCMQIVNILYADWFMNCG